MLPLATLLSIVWAHFMGDFVWQSDAMAQGKSKDWGALSAHVLAYACALFMMSLPAATFGQAASFVLVNAALHFVVDAGTSRWTAYLYGKMEAEKAAGAPTRPKHMFAPVSARHQFFCVIGFDQAIHMTCLLATGSVWLT